MSQRRSETKYPSAIRKRVEGDWNCPKCQNLNFSFRDKCNKCQSSKEILNAFNCAIYISAPLISEETHEELPPHTYYALSQLPSISPFLRDKFMKTPSIINPITSRLLNFNKENVGDVDLSEKIVNEAEEKVNIEELLSKVKKPKTQKKGDWLCLGCNNLNFAFRKECNVCGGSKVEFKEISY